MRAKLQDETVKRLNSVTADMFRLDIEQIGTDKKIDALIDEYRKAQQQLAQQQTQEKSQQLGSSRR